MKINLFNYIFSIYKKKKKYKKRSLNAPTTTNGYIHRWIREGSININKKISNPNTFLRSGYELVKANKHRNRFPVINKGKFKGYIGYGGLMLAKISKKIINERKGN